MAKAIFRQQIVEIQSHERTYYDKHTALFGLVSWWRKVRTDKIGDDLHIFTDVELKDIYLNGKSLLTTTQKHGTETS